MLFSIIVDCDEKGKVSVWAQQKEKLSPENLEKLSRMMLSVKRSVSQETINNELQFSVKHEKEP